MSEEEKVTDYGSFVRQARDFKAALDEGGFNEREVAAMLGIFVLCIFQQRFATDYPPGFYELPTKQNLVNDQFIAEGSE